MPLHNNNMQPTDELGASPLPMSFHMGEGGGHHMDNINPMDQGGISMGGSMGGYQGVDMSLHTMGSSSAQVGDPIMGD